MAMLCENDSKHLGFLPCYVYVVIKPGPCDFLSIQDTIVQQVGLVSDKVEMVFRRRSSKGSLALARAVNINPGAR